MIVRTLVGNFTHLSFGSSQIRIKSMGYFGRLEDKLKAQELRRQGLSYGEIQQQINVQKSTLSDWCKDISLTEKQKLRLLSNKMFGQKKGSLVAAENKRRERILKTNNARVEAKKDIGRVSGRESFIAGVALYAAEGTKRDNNVGIANSDPLLIMFMMKWFLKFTKISPDRIRGAIWIHEELDEKEAKIFWSKLTGIPLNQFNKTYIAKIKKDTKKIRKNIHKYGVFTIRFSDSMIHRKIMGWILALFDGKIVNIPL